MGYNTEVEILCKSMKRFYSVEMIEREDCSTGIVRHRLCHAELQNTYGLSVVVIGSKAVQSPTGDTENMLHTSCIPNLK